MLKNCKPTPSIIWLILIFAFIKGLCYVAQIPPWQSPDEVNHFVIVRELMVNGIDSIRHPVSSQEIFNEIQHSMDIFKFNDISPNVQITLNKEERPPFYYFINAAMLKLFNINELINQFYFCRLLSVILGLGTILSGYFITREVFPNDSILLAAVPLLISFLPQYTIVHSSVNPDSLENFLSALFTLFILKTVQEKNNIRLHIIIALIIALAILTKRTAIVLIPVWFIAILFYKKKTIILYITAISCAAIAIFINTLLPNTLINFLDPFQEFAKYFNMEILSIHYWLKFHEHLFVTFVGVFGWLKFPLPGIWYYFIALFAIIAIIANLQVLLKDKKTIFNSPKLLILLGIITVTYISIFLVYGIRYRVYPQGRYLFPAIIPIAIFSAKALNRLKFKQQLSLWLVCLFIILFALDIFTMSNYIFSSFRMFLPL